MTAPTKGNTTSSNQNPAGNFKTYSHNQNAGNNRLLVVQVTMANTTNYASCTYNGVSMTLLYNKNRYGLSQRMAVFYLVNPATGTNTVRINFTGNQWNPISVLIKSFTDSGGIGAFGNSGGPSTPNTKTLTVEQDSLIMMSSCSNNAILTQQIPTGTNQAFTTHNTNKQVATGAITANAGHNAGSISLRATSTSGNITLDRFEIKGLTTPTPTPTPLNRRRIIIS
jgi:hypothetical protein